MQNVIEVKDLKKTYNQGKKNAFEAVNGVSFSVQKGEIFGILGPNGAGKTTTLEIIEGLRAQTSGTINVLGFDNLENADKVKERIGIQLQSSEYLHHLTLGELLDLFASLYPMSLRVQPTCPPKPWRRGKQSINRSPRSDALPRDDRRKALLKLVNLEDKEHELVSKLSGGQKQRFTIATSLVHNPDILFLDEPTTGLDPSARRNLWQLVKNINKQGITIILTTHYMEEAEFLCNRVAIMDSGKILEIDEPKKLIDRLSETTQISFFTESQINQELFKTLPEIKKIHASYPKVILEITNLDKVSAVISLLKQNNIVFYGFMVKTATLEDVYLDLTGHEFEEE